MRVNRFLQEGDKVLYDRREEASTIIQANTDRLEVEGPREGEYEVIYDESAETGFRARHRNQDGSWSNWYNIHNFWRAE